MTITGTINNQDLLVAHFETIADAPGGVARLRELILQQAVQGRLVEQDPTDEPASVLLERISAEKSQLMKEGRLSKGDVLEAAIKDERPFEVPQRWVWTKLATLLQHLQTGPFGSNLHKEDYQVDGVP